MAKVSYVDIPDELVDSFYSNLTAQSRFTNARITKRVVLLSRAKIKGLSQKSLLPQITALWNGFSDAQRIAWNVAGAANDMTGFRLFVQDQCLREKNGFAGVSTPSALHQGWVGWLNVSAPATEIKIIQMHPHFYYVLRKVTGTKSSYNPVKITEDFGFPLQISLNYSSNLVSQGAGSYAKFYADVWSSYQGRDIHTLCEIDLDLVSDWKSATATLSTVIGYPVSYDLYFHLYNVRGDLYFDDVVSKHNDINWARDWKCNNINVTFTHAFYQVPKNWVATVFPDGAIYDSIYLDFV